MRQCIPYIKHELIDLDYVPRIEYRAGSALPSFAFQTRTEPECRAALQDAKVPGCCPKYVCQAQCNRQKPKNSEVTLKFTASELNPDFVCPPAHNQFHESIHVLFGISGQLNFVCLVYFFHKMSCLIGHFSLFLN